MTSKSLTTTDEIPSPTPGEVLLLDFIEPMGLIQNGLARAIGVAAASDQRGCPGKASGHRGHGPATGQVFWPVRRILAWPPVGP